MNKNLRCINCNNHGDFVFVCNISHPNFERRHEQHVNLSECFEIHRVHKSMDQLISDKL